jgi:formylmethanofuran dehydrogenase subunit A
LKNKGHLGPGADADVTIYTPGDDKRAMFELPRYVLKAGEVVAENGEIRGTPFGTTQHVAPEFDMSLFSDLRGWWDRHGSVPFECFPIADEIAVPGGG